MPDGVLLQTVLELLPALAPALQKLGHKPKDTELQVLVQALQTKMIQEGLDGVNRKLDTNTKIAEYNRGILEELKADNH